MSILTLLHCPLNGKERNAYIYVLFCILINVLLKKKVPALRAFSTVDLNRIIASSWNYCDLSFRTSKPRWKLFFFAFLGHTHLCSVFGPSGCSVLYRVPGIEACLNIISPVLLILPLVENIWQHFLKQFWWLNSLEMNFHFLIESLYQKSLWVAYLQGFQTILVIVQKLS